MTWDFQHSTGAESVSAQCPRCFKHRRHTIRVKTILPKSRRGKVKCLWVCVPCARELFPRAQFKRCGIGGSYRIQRVRWTKKEQRRNDETDWFALAAYANRHTPPPWENADGLARTCNCLA